MSAIPIMRLAGSAPSPAPIPEGVTWIELCDAARLTGWTDRHLRRLCGEKWIEAGLARTGKGSAGQQTYWIRSDAHESLKPKTQTFDLDKLTSKQRDRLLYKKSIIEDWKRRRAMCENGELEDARLACAQEHKISVRTLAYWEQKFDAGDEALLDGRSRDRQGEPQYPEYRAEVEAQFLHEGGIHITTCHRIAKAICRRNGQLYPDGDYIAKDVVARLNRKNKAKVVMLREGKDAFANRVCAYDERDYEHFFVNGELRDMFASDIWCADHHPCDVLCWKPNRGADPNGPRTADTGRFFRPWLTVWEDIRSRRIVGRYFSDAPPTSTNVMLALRDGIVRCGNCTPLYAYTDNGKDFDCWQLQGQTKWQRRKYRVFGHGASEEQKARSLGIYQRLKIQVIHAQPYNAKAKPVERWFGFYEGDFGKLQPTYTGRNPQEKPERLAHALESGQAPTFEEYVQRASGWIDLIYNASHNHSGHGMNGRTPDAVYAATLVEKRIVQQDELNACLHKHEDLLKVGSNGVKAGGRLYGQGDPTLAAFFGQYVEVRYDPNDITWASIWSDQGVHLCDVDWNKRAIFGAMKEQEYNQANKTSRRHNKNLREVARRGMQMVTDPTEIILQDAAEQLRQKNGQDYVPPDPPAETIKLVRTGLTPKVEDQSQPLRKAVGAESLSMPSPQEKSINWAQFADDEVAGSNRGTIDIFSNVGEEL